MPGPASIVRLGLSIVDCPNTVAVVVFQPLGYILFFLAASIGNPSVRSELPLAIPRVLALFPRVAQSIDRTRKQLRELFDVAAMECRVKSIGERALGAYSASGPVCCSPASFSCF